MTDFVRESPKRLDVLVSGGIADENRMAVGDLIAITQTLQTALRGVGSVLTGGKAGLSGRSKGEVEAATELHLLAEPRAGSVVLELGLAPEPPAIPGAEQPHLGERALDALIEGMNSLNDESDELPQGFDPGVLQTLKRLGPVLRRGYKLDLAVEDGTSSAANPRHRAHVDQSWLGKVDGLTHKPLRAHLTLEGVLQMVDLGASPLQCRIDRSYLPSVLCLIANEREGEVLAALGKQVQVTGEGEFERGSDEPRRITLDELAIVTQVAGVDPARFREHADWRDLAAAQGVEPLTDPESLGGVFENDDELDEFLALRSPGLQS